MVLKIAYCLLQIGGPGAYLRGAALAPRQMAPQFSAAARFGQASGVLVFACRRVVERRLPGKSRLAMELSTAVRLEQARDVRMLVVT